MKKLFVVLTDPDTHPIDERAVTVELPDGVVSMSPRDFTERYLLPAAVAILAEKTRG